MKLYKTLAGALAAASIGLAAPAIAHPQLVSATPAPTASVKQVDRIVLTFSEPLVAAVSGFEVVMTGMPGMAYGHEHQPMKINGVTVKVGPDGKSLVGTLAHQLPRGSYDVNWHVVASDTHRVTGKVSFTVQ
jgi:methionine-rich copper-binding protein CopC